MIGTVARDDRQEGDESLSLGCSRSWPPGRWLSPSAVATDCPWNGAHVIQRGMRRGAVGWIPEPGPGGSARGFFGPGANWRCRPDNSPTVDGIPLHLRSASAPIGLQQSQADHPIWFNPEVDHLVAGRKEPPSWLKRFALWSKNPRENRLACVVARTKSPPTEIEQPCGRCESTSSMNCSAGAGCPGGERSGEEHVTDRCERRIIQRPPERRAPTK